MGTPFFIKRSIYRGDSYCSAQYTLIAHSITSLQHTQTRYTTGGGKKRGVLTIHGERHDLWRAVDQDDNVLDILVQSRRNKHAAKKFVRTLLKGLQYVPRVIIADKLKSYVAAKRETLPGVAHRQSRSLNNRCEHSHRPTRQREYRMQGLKSAGHAQRFLSAYGPIAHHFRPRRHLLSAADYRQEMRKRFASWAEVTSTERAA